MAGSINVHGSIFVQTGFWIFKSKKWLTVPTHGGATEYRRRETLDITIRPGSKKIDADSKYISLCTLVNSSRLRSEKTSIKTRFGDIVSSNQVQGETSPPADLLKF